MTLCEWMVSEYGDEMREAVRLTDEYGVEHGFMVTGMPDDHVATNIISGSEDSIDIVTSVSSAFRPTRVGFHTHPSGSLTLSESDWRGFLTEHAQHAPDAEFPTGWQRGTVVGGSRLGEADGFGIRAAYLTPAGVGKPVDEQRGFVEAAFDVLSDQSVGVLGADGDIAAAMGEAVEVCTATVES